MQKILIIFSALICLLLAAGCQKDKEEPTPPARTPSQYTLTYSAGENGSIDGISPQTVNHGGDGSPVTAVPAEHHHFVGWSDGVTAASRIDADVTADISVTANFAIDQHIVTYSAGENGSIDGVISQKVDHGGTGSAVTAAPVIGYHFVSWSDGVATASRTDSDVTADLSMTASFALNQYTLTYGAGKNGSIEGVSPQTVDHGGTGNAVTAVPAEHHHFVKWSDGVSTPGRTDRKVTADLAVTANFAIDQYTVIYSAGENGYIEGDWSQKVDHGDTGSIVTAKPADGYHFMSWSDGVATARRSDSKITTDLSVTASFAINQYTLSYAAEENGTIGGAGIQTVDHGGDAVAVAAVAEKGYHFVTWSDGLKTAQRIDSKITGDLAVSAVFEINTYTVGGTVSGLVEGTEVVLQNNGGDDLVITSNGDFNFTTELLDAGTYEVRVLTQPTSPNQTCTVTSSTGTISGANVTDVVVACVLTTYTIGGTIYGLPDSDQVVLQNNEGDDLIISANGAFTFATALDDGSEYEITVYSQPKRPNWNCELENAAGSLAGMDVTDINVDCFPEVVLQATAGISKIKLNWNSYDFSEVAFNLCRAQDDISNAGFGNCQDLKEGILETKVNNPLIVSQLTNDIPYWFQLEARYESGRQTLSEVIKAIPFGGLNDSGIDWCSDDSTNRERDGTRSEKTKGCEAVTASHPGQDALYGRDALARARKLAKTGIGSAGFDFTKFCLNGEAAGEGKCPPNPLPGKDSNNWACARDNVTGLTWEIKMDSGLRSKSNTYTWFNLDETVNGGQTGLENGGICEGSNCDTQAYVKAINELALCGASDWRLPTKMELLSIVDNGSFKPAVDARFFPNTLSLYYWSSSPNPEDENSAWHIYFLYGEVSPSIKSESNHIRLVRGRTVTFGLDNP